MHRKVDAIATKWDPKFANAAATALRHDKRELVKRMQTKAEVEWTVIGRKWDEYFERFADESWREEFMPLIEGLVTEQGESWNTTLGMQFDVRNYLAEAWLDDYMLTFAQDINNTTKKDVSQMLNQAMREGWGIDEMSTQLSATWDRYLTQGYNGQGLTDQEREWFEERQPRYRRDMISRTETMRASNSGSHTLFKGMGAQKKEWWATGDDRTRDSHLAAWQKYSEGGNPGPILTDQYFEVGGARLMYPGDPSGPPEEVIQCRCTELPYMDTWAGTEEEIATARADMDAEVARREAEAVVPEPEVEPELELGKVGGVAPVGPDTTIDLVEEWLVEGLGMGSLVSYDDATMDGRGMAKYEIVEALFEKTFAEGQVIPRESINQFIRQWAETSNDDDMRSLAMQKAASELFGVPLSKFTQDKIDLMEHARRRIDEDELRDPKYSFLLPDNQQKAILQAMYDNTQEQLAAAGFGPNDTIRLRRGVDLPDEITEGWNIGDVIPVEGNALESWSVGEATAKRFGATVLEMDIPVEAIIGSARTGYGCLHEGELVVLGSLPGEAKILRVRVE